eukprot:9384502-Karenia_brevis.AAC.1
MSGTHLEKIIILPRRPYLSTYVSAPCIYGYRPKTSYVLILASCPKEGCSTSDLTNVSKRRDEELIPGTLYVLSEKSLKQHT